MALGNTEPAPFTVEEAGVDEPVVQPVNAEETEGPQHPVAIKRNFRDIEEEEETTPGKRGRFTTEPAVVPILRTRRSGRQRRMKACDFFIPDPRSQNALFDGEALNRDNVVLIYAQLPTQIPEAEAKVDEPAPTPPDEVDQHLAEINFADAEAPAVEGDVDSTPAPPEEVDQFLAGIVLM